MTRVNNYPLLIEFVPGTRLSRELEVVSKLPIVQNGPWNVCRLRRRSDGAAARVKDLDVAPSALGLTLSSFGVGGSTEIQQALAAMTQKGAHAVVVLPDNLIWFHRAQILDLATRSQLPTICMFERSMPAHRLARERIAACPM
jgi:hypothetical protein